VWVGRITQGNTPLLIAVRVGSTDITRLILEAETPLRDSRAAMMSQLDTVLAASAGATTPRAHKKQATDTPPQVTRADPARSADRALRVAASHGHWGIVAMLLGYQFKVCACR